MKHILTDLTNISSSSLIEVQCPKCDQIDKVRYGRHVRIFRSKGYYLCHKCACRASWTKERRIKLASTISDKWKNKEYRQNVVNSQSKSSSKISDSNRRRWKDKQYRIKMSKQSAGLWDNELYRNKLEELMSEEWYKQKQKSGIRSKWAEEKYRDKIIKAIKERWKDDSYRNKTLNTLYNNGGSSRQQESLYSILDDLSISYEKEYQIGPWRFDCFLVDYDILIEVQGIYWHSLPDRITRDKAKSTYIKKYKPDLDLKYLWEHEFDNKDRIVNLIKYWTGHEFAVVNFSFDDIEFKNTNSQEAELFISKYHYSGRLNKSGFRFGFYLGDTLCGLVTFNHPHRKEIATKQELDFNEVLVLDRLVIHPAYQKQNFPTFMIGRSIKEISKLDKYKMLITFADKTHNHHGTVYRASNWEIDGIVPPDYWYADPDGYVCHKKTIYNRAKKNKMTEAEYVETYGYVKVKGFEKIRFVYRLKKRSRK